MSDLSTMTAAPDQLDGLLREDSPPLTLALVIVWSRREPQRVGEVAFVSSLPKGDPWHLGRGDAAAPAGTRFLTFYRQRPGLLEPTGLLTAPHLSRTQLRIQGVGEALRVENVGRCPLVVRGQELVSAEVRPGEILELRSELLLLVVRRPSLMPAHGEEARLNWRGFGEADLHGLVGESPAIWELRAQLSFVGPRQTHVLLLGESGTGKELVAKALHQLSPRRARAIVSRNAATFPETLIDAELFGNAKNYPNPGMAERPGLIGEADNGTLFLDEIGELPQSLQAHFLRVLDQGEYQRLGESTLRRSNLRLIGATNRPEESLKHDFLARLKVRVYLPNLNQRREDIPLIVRYLLKRMASGDPGLAERYLANTGAYHELCLSPSLMAAFLQHAYSTHVRELEALLWQAMSESVGERLELTEGMLARLARVGASPAAQGLLVQGASGAVSATSPVPSAAVSGTLPPSATGAASSPPGPGPRVNPAEVTRDQLVACLEKHGWVQDRVWPELGLPNRFALYRLMKKFELRGKSKAADGGEDERP